MKWTVSVGMTLALGGCLLSSDARAIEILAPGDAILAIDLDPPSSDSSYPEGEAPAFAVDGTLAKYLNFAGAGSGLIVTPQNLTMTPIVTGIQLTTANDAEARDPTSYEVWGTNDAIVSADNSTGLDENWTLISSGGVTLPPARDTLGDLVTFANSDAYTSYKVLFPTNKGSGLFQIAEVELFGTVPGVGDDLELLFEDDPTLAVHFGPDSQFPGAEGPANVLDDDAGTKYLNFGRENSGFIVTPAGGPSTVKTFQITTANDSESRDPTSWELYGANEPIASMENSQGDGEMWTLIESGSVDLPTERLAEGPFVQIENDTEYASYRMVFPTIRDPDAGDADSMQIGGVQFYSVTIPEPASCGLAALAGLALLASARGRRLDLV